MHPSRPLEADWVARWPGDQRRARGSRRGRVCESRASRVSCAHSHTESRGASVHATAIAVARSSAAPPAKSWRLEDAAEPCRRVNDRVVEHHAQRFLVRINDVVDEPPARRRMKHQKDNRPLRPIIERHCRGDTVRPVHFRRDGLDPAAVLLARQRIGVEDMKLLVVLRLAFRLSVLAARRQRTDFPVAMILLPRLPESQGRGERREQESLFKRGAALLGERLLSRDQRIHVVLGVRGPPRLGALGKVDRPPRAMRHLRGLMRDDL
jgi:hypothetical protein